MLNEDVNSTRNVSFESYKERITNFSQEFEIGLFIFILNRSLVWIALVMLTALASAFIYLRYTAPTYEARSVLQLRNNNTAKQILSMNSFGEETQLLEADVELMRSKVFLARVIDQLPFEVSYYNRGQILTEEYYVWSFFKVHDLVIQDSSIVDVPVNLVFDGKDAFRLWYSVQGVQFEGTYKPFETLRTKHFSCRITVDDHPLLNDPETKQNLYFRINSRNGLIGRYAPKLIVDVADYTAKTVSISFRDENPKLALDMVATAAKEFIVWDVERRSESAENVIEFIRTQKDTVASALRESESRLQDFRMDNRVADLNQLTPIFLERSERYEDDRTALTLEIELLKAMAKATDRPMPEINSYDLLPMLTGTNYEGVLSKTINELLSLLSERERMYTEATDKNMEIISLERRIDIQKKVVLESLKELLRRAEQRRDDLDAVQAEFEGRYRTLPEKELEFARIERIFAINEKYYTLLLEKDIEYNISKAGFVPENRILEDAVLPYAPIFPKRNLILAYYLATGLIISFLIVLIRYVLHDNITSLHDISKLSHASISILGMVPKYKKEIPISQLLIDKNPKSLIAESFRTIRTNLQFVDNTDGPKVIAITSTISGEGKTFVAINLAGIISFSGKRVVILDLDMRKPKIHLGFGVENIRGMSTLLIKKDELENCIQHSSLPGLDFVTAGPIPPNPSELIISARMQELLDRLKTMYDVILIDNPPVGLVTDGIPIIQSADFPIYIFRADYSKKQFVQNVDRLINENNIRRLSTILNGVDIDRNKYGYNY
ncbi:MAG TPA: polysaccharide biosynthesis tyrosine autokinase, partial [Flavobacteriales bacterium]|nr:polysaccharide biosynthesis tyrosine autokinase [Flavobacteriales bacterium]